MKFLIYIFGCLIFTLSCYEAEAGRKSRPSVAARREMGGANTKAAATDAKTGQPLPEKPAVTVPPVSLPPSTHTAQEKKYMLEIQKHNPERFNTFVDILNILNGEQRKTDSPPIASFGEFYNQLTASLQEKLNYIVEQTGFKTPENIAQSYEQKRQTLISAAAARDTPTLSTLPPPPRSVAPSMPPIPSEADLIKQLLPQLQALALGDKTTAQVAALLALRLKQNSMATDLQWRIFMADLVQENTSLQNMLVGSEYANEQLNEELRYLEDECRKSTATQLEAEGTIKELCDKLSQNTQEQKHRLKKAKREAQAAQKEATSPLQARVAELEAQLIHQQATAQQQQRVSERQSRESADTIRVLHEAKSTAEQQRDQVTALSETLSQELETLRAQLAEQAQDLTRVQKERDDAHTRSGEALALVQQQQRYAEKHRHAAIENETARIRAEQGLAQVQRQAVFMSQYPLLLSAVAFVAATQAVQQLAGLRTENERLHADMNAARQENERLHLEGQRAQGFISYLQSQLAALDVTRRSAEKQALQDQYRRARQVSELQRTLTALSDTKARLEKEKCDAERLLAEQRALREEEITLVQEANDKIERLSLYNKEFAQSNGALTQENADLRERLAALEAAQQATPLPSSVPTHDDPLDGGASASATNVKPLRRVSPDAADSTLGDE